MKTRKFELGAWLCTPGAEEAYASNIKLLPQLLMRHLSCDWGDMCAEDKALNDEALRTGGRLFSAYEPAGMPRVWIITEADRSATTILLPSEY